MNDKATILAVDDTSESLALLVKILTAADYLMRPADSGELALAAVEANPPDLILLDIRMPGMDGFEVCRRLKAREQTRHIPIILISAFGDVKEWVAGLRLGAVDYIAKPFQPEELLARVATHLALSQARVSLEMQAAALRQANEQLQSEMINRRGKEEELRLNLDRATRSRLAMLGVLEEQKRSNQALRASEAEFRVLAESMPQIVWITRADGWNIYFNQQWMDYTGLTLQESLGHGWNKPFHPDDRQRAWDAWQGATEIIGTYSIESRLRRADGAYRWWLVRGVPLRNANGEILKWFGTCTDIHDMKLAELEIARYVAQLQIAVMSTVEVATTLSEMRDPYTAGHERRVAEIAVAIGAELGFDARRQEGLRVAGHLHDVGKITIPSEILSKPGKISAIELQLIQCHAQAGYDVLKDVEFPWPVAQVALQHHERMDGSGYPQGLKGEAILLEARIMAVADVVEAISSHRPYRPALGIDAALAEINRGRGTAYDPVVVDACMKLFREKGYAIPA